MTGKNKRKEREQKEYILFCSLSFLFYNQGQKTGRFSSNNRDFRLKKESSITVNKVPY